ncbi:MAG: heme-binding protein [Pseudomonadota bacterium]
MQKILLCVAQTAMATAFLLTSGRVEAQTPRPDMDYDTAMQIIDACVSFAEENDIAISIAVFDASAALKAFVRMNGAHNASVSISQWKGHTAASFKNASTADIAEWAMNNPGLAFAPGVSTLEGGVPVVLKSNGAQIGGVGVSGATSSQDAACARSGVEAAGLEAP